MGILCYLWDLRLSVPPFNRKHKRKEITMLGRGKGKDATDERIVEHNANLRAHQLRKDPSSIKGMTQTELNEVIDSGTISRATLNEILRH